VRKSSKGKQTSGNARRGRVRRRACGRVAPYLRPRRLSKHQHLWSSNKSSGARSSMSSPQKHRRPVLYVVSCRCHVWLVSSTVSTVPPPWSCVSVAPYHGSTSVSPDASIDLQLPHIDSPIPSHESSILGAAVSPAGSSPTAPLRPILSSPQPLPLKGWQPSPSDPPTSLPDPIQDVSLPYWHELAVHLGRIPPQTAAQFLVQNAWLREPLPPEPR